MNIGIMRFIDYWAGVPICFSLSILNGVLKTLGLTRKAGASDKKILFIKLSEMGAVVVAYPLLKEIKKDHPGSELFFLMFGKNREVFEALDNIIPADNIFTIRDDSIISFIFDTMKTVAALRRMKIDVVFDLEFFSRCSAILAYMIGAGKRVGFYRYRYEGLYRGDLLTHKIQYNPLIHTSRSYLSLRQMIGLKEKNSPELVKRDEDSDITLPRYRSVPAAQAHIRGILLECGVNDDAKIFLMNPGEGLLPVREWDLENFISLATEILKDARNHIVIVGTRSRKADILHERLGGKRCINLVGKTTVRDLLELCSISSALIANDCGLPHLASLTPVKKFIIFGPESPNVFGPIGDNSWTVCANLPCSPCLSAFNHRNSSCKDARCLKAIKHEDVYELIRQNVP